MMTYFLLGLATGAIAGGATVLAFGFLASWLLTLGELTTHGVARPADDDPADGGKMPAPRRAW
jgi:hypothetical protein